MARISTYVADNNIVPDDKVLGTDATGQVTKNYTFRGIATWLNNTGAISINGQHNYFFQTAQEDIGRLPGTISFAGYGGNCTPFSDVTTMMISEEDLTLYTIENYLETIVGETILLSQLSNTNNFGIFVVDSLTRNIAEPGFYDMTLTFTQGNSSLFVGQFYGLSVYAGGGVNDKNYVYTQAIPSATWNITHNLDKYPSVSAVNINNIVYYGNVTYIDTNNLTIEFSAGFSGKAYMN